MTQESPGERSAGPPLGTSPPPLRYVLRALARYRRPFVAALTWSVVFVVVPMQVPLLTGYLVNGITGQGATFFGVFPVSDGGEVLWLSVAGLVGVAAAYGVAAFHSTSSIAELSRRFVAGLRKALVHKLDTSSVEVHERFGSGELLNRVLVDTQSTREFVETVFFDTIQNVLRVAYPVLVLFLLSPVIALVAASLLPVQFVVTRRLQARLRVATRIARTTQGRLTAAVKENLDGIEAIQTSNAEGVAIRRLWAQSDALATDQIAARRYSGLIAGSTWALTSFGLAMTWWIGGMQVLGGTLGLGALVAITGYVVLLYSPMQRFTAVANVYQKGLVAFERIQEVLSTPSLIRDDPAAPPLRLTAGRVELRDVSFAYRGRLVLRGVSMDLTPGEVTLLLGRNGSGKSTLVKLLSRLHDPVAGAVLIDGQDLRSVRLTSLRSQVAVVPQETTLFTGSIADNLRLGRPGASDADLEEACRSAGALEFVRHLPQGMGTQVGPGKGRLSGGESQRLAIARALLRRPRVLLLDEPNSALDEPSEKQLSATLESLKRKMTVVVIAHHATALAATADRIIRLESGTVSEDTKAPLPGRPRHRNLPSTETSGIVEGVGA